MPTRTDRLRELERALKEYAAAEKRRIENEVSALEQILQGRTGGAGVQSVAIEAVSAVAANDLTAFLSEEE